MVRNGAFSNKIDYITIFLVILNLKGHQNRITGQSGEASRWRVCYQRGLPRLVYLHCVTTKL